ncbi:BTAD domain-containing putative transcriptional regulator [Roseomonas sp. CCTCC AB2023176]|uniref:BTAD domain-containing putative transcriptional regulator n=1 Tax=Roseomonas sp. CCTCC AB2023176 TaxID=3342640 RepID=UPI0035E395D3
MRPVGVTLLGPVRLSGPDGAERPLPTRKSRALLAFLVLARGRPVSRGRLASLLWERSGEVEARGSLRGAVAELSRAIGDTGILRADRDSLRIEPASLAVDLFALDQEDVIPDVGTAPLLDGLENIGEAFSEWLIGEREAWAARFRARCEAALERARGEPEVAIALAERLVAFDPTQEGAWRTLMRLHAEAGDRARALAEYERCRAALRRALEVDPSPETRDLAAQIRGGSALVARGVPALLAAPARADPAAPRRPRVGVLPFAATGPAETEALGLAYAEETALELARSRDFDVIAPIALMHLRGGGAEAAFRAHGLDYVVDGAVRGRSGERAVVLSLLDVSGLARPLWSARLALDLGSVGEVEREPLLALVARLAPAIAHIEGTRPHATSVGDLVLRAIPLLNTLRSDSFAHAGEMLAEAVVREPDNATAAAWAARWHVFQVGQGWARDPVAAMDEAERLAALAISLDPESSEALAVYGHVSSFLHRDLDSGNYYLERSLELNPNQASVLALSAATQTYLGRPAEALNRLERYRRLTPNHPHDRVLGTVFTIAHFFAGDFQEAVLAGRRAVRATPDFTNAYKPLLAAMGHLRQGREAKTFLEALLKREPGFNVHDFIRTYPFRRREDREAYAEGLLLAGAPKT